MSKRTRNPDTDSGGGANVSPVAIPRGPPGASAADAEDLLSGKCCCCSCCVDSASCAIDLRLGSPSGPGEEAAPLPAAAAAPPPIRLLKLLGPLLPAVAAEEGAPTEEAAEDDTTLLAPPPTTVSGEELPLFIMPSSDRDTWPGEKE